MNYHAGPDEICLQFAGKSGEFDIVKCSISLTAYELAKLFNIKYLINNMQCNNFVNDTFIPIL